MHLHNKMFIHCTSTGKCLLLYMAQGNGVNDLHMDQI